MSVRRDFYTDLRKKFIAGPSESFLFRFLMKERLSDEKKEDFTQAPLEELLEVLADRNQKLHLDEENRRWLWELGARAGGRRLWEKLESTRLPLCARCTGILMGELLAVLLWLLWHPGWLLSLALLLPMAYDGIFQYVYYVMSNNRKRVVTGLLAGYGSMTLYIRLVLLLVSRIR